MSKTLTELTKINDENLSGQVADELLEGAPLARVINAQPSSYSDKHSWLVYDDASTAGFRDMNDGKVHTGTTDRKEDIDCKILDNSFTADTATASGYRFGTSAYLERESRRHLRTSFAKVERQILNGTASGSAFADANGFLGLADYTGTLATAGVFNGGGSTNLSSVYMIRSADDGASLILGNDGNITVAPAVRQRIPGATGHYGAWFVEVMSWYAFQYGSIYSRARIANVDSQATTPVVTDDLLATGISYFPADRQPTHIIMNRPLMRQLRESRTATNQTGAPAPFPTEAFGIPIVVTDQIGTDETAVA